MSLIYINASPRRFQEGGGEVLSVATVAALWKNHPPCGPIVLVLPVVVLVCQHRYSRHYSAPSYLAQRDLKVKRIHYVLCAPTTTPSIPASSASHPHPHPGSPWSWVLLPVAHSLPLFYLLFQFVCRRGETIKIHFIVAAPAPTARRHSASFIPFLIPQDITPAAALIVTLKLL